jgi:aquaporin Z
MARKDGKAEDGRAGSAREQLIAVVGEKRYRADWTNDRHRAMRLLSEFIGTFGLLFVLSAGAGAITAGTGAPLSRVALVALLSLISALWLVAAISALGDLSSHFNPAMTFAFTLRGDMHWYMAAAYWVVQFAAAGAGSLLARAFFGTSSHLAATMPPPGREWAAVGFEALITAGLVLVVLAMAAGPKLNGPFVPLVVGAYIFSLGMTGGAVRWVSHEPGARVRAGPRAGRVRHAVGLSRRADARRRRSCAAGHRPTRAGDGARGGHGAERRAGCGESVARRLKG